MPVSCTLYSFKKRVNSTAQPSGGSVFSCYLKNETGIINPTFIFDFKSENAPNYNYAYIPDFNRYYFINEWTWIEGNWNATMTVDVLSSYKTDIGQTSLYITRSSATSSTYIADVLYPLTSENNINVVYDANPWETESISNGTMILGIDSTDVFYYALSYSDYSNFISYIFSDPYMESVMGTWQDAFPQAKTIYNPMQYINSIYWLPLKGVRGVPTNSIGLGWGNVPNFNGIKISDTARMTGTLSFTVPNHPQVTRGRYLNNAPFSSYTLFIPPWGIIPLDSAIMANTATVYGEWTVDLRTGMGTLNIRLQQRVGELSFYYARLESVVGVPYRISRQVSNGPIDSNVGLISGLKSATLDVLGMIKNATNAIEDAFLNTIPYVNGKGENGGVNQLRGLPSLNCNFFLIADEDNSNKGRPLCTTTTPAALGGYMIALEGDVKIEGTDFEMNKIKNYLEGGFYYE